MTLRRTLTAVLAAAALVAPAAQAEPADMHASVATAAAKARADAPPKQDLRSADARDAGQPPRPSGYAVNASRPTPVDSASRLPATDGGGSPVPVLPLVAGALLVLAAAVGARYATRRMHRRARIAA
jgi:hypothetical protein